MAARSPPGEAGRASQRDGVGEDARVLRLQAAAGDHVHVGAQEVLEGEFQAGVIEQRRSDGEGPSSGLVAGDAGAVCLGAGMALWDAGCACGDTHRAGRGIPAPTQTPPGLPAAARDPAPLGGLSEKPDAGHTTDCVIPARRATRRVQRHALGRVARLIWKVIRVEQRIGDSQVNGL